MKNVILCVLMCMGLLGYGQTITEEDLLGKWEFQGVGYPFAYIDLKAGRVTFTEAHIRDNDLTREDIERHEKDLLQQVANLKGTNIVFKKGGIYKFTNNGSTQKVNYVIDVIDGKHYLASTDSELQVHIELEGGVMNWITPGGNNTIYFKKVK